MSTWMRNTLAAAILGGAALVSPAAFAQEAVCEPTAAEHVALAQQYAQQAASYQHEAASERAVAESYARWLPGNRAGQPNPKAAKRAEEKLKTVQQTEQKAAEAQRLAEYHAFRAQEMRCG